jgi:flagellar hook-associated protein 3 FlgL
MYRVTTANAFASSVDNIQRRQQELNRSQEQLTSQKRVLLPSDDPAAAARAERSRSLMQRSDATQRAVDASKNSMTLTESALGDAVDLMQRARELVVAAGNASYSDDQRADVAKELTEIRKQLLSVANRGDGAGGYVFAGQGASQPPFLDASGGVTYVGLGGEVQVASDEPLPLTFDGQQTWLSAASGNGVFVTSSNSSSAWIDAGRVTDPSAITGSSYEVQFTKTGSTTTYSIVKDGTTTMVSGQAFESGKSIEVDGMAFSITGDPANGDTFEITPSADDLSVFDTLDSIISDLKTTSRTPSQIAQTVQSGLRDIDSVTGQLQSTRSLAGEILNRIDGVTNRVADLKLYADETRSSAEDLDMVKAISDFQNRQTGFSAALQTYASLQKMSMFDYIK